MRLYFLSSKPCILRVGGAYFGSVGDFEKFADVCLKDNLFLEFIPQGAMPVCFFLNESLLFSPPDGVELYLTPHGAAIYVTHFPPNDFSLKLIAQTRHENTLATLFQQGDVQLAIENGQDFFCATLPQGFENAQLQLLGDLFLLKSPTALCVFNRKAERLLYKKYTAFTDTENGFSITTPLGDSLRRCAKASYRLQNGTLERESYILLAPQGKEHTLTAYAFFESLFIGADFRGFLSDELQEKANELKEFLGDFLYVLPTDEEDKIGLVKKRRERVFDVIYYKVVLKDNKITDIQT